MDILMCMSSVFAFVVLMLILLDYLWKPKLDLPYPKRVPLLGHLVWFVKAPHLMTMVWAEQLGDIYCLQLLHKTIVIVSSYEKAHQVLVTKGNEFAGRSANFRSGLVSEWGQDIIFQTMNPTWKKLRMFTHRNIKQYGEGLGRIEDIVQENAMQLVKGIEMNSKNGAFDPYNNVYLAIGNSIGALITGNSLTYDDPLFQTLIKMERLLVPSLTLPQGAELDAFPWLRYFGNPTYNKLSAYNDCAKETYETLREMHRNHELSADGIAARLFEEMDNKDAALSDILRDGIVRVVINNILLAGFSTSGAAFYSFFQLMAVNQEVQENLFKEILHNKSDADEPMGLSDRANMPYTRACLLELMRYTSIAPSTFEHRTLLDTDIQGHKIPKGTEVYVNLFTLHHSDKFWNEPWKFRPERFLDEEGQLVPSDHINRKQLLPFGAGPRVCIGQTFAMARLFILMTSVIKAFQICPAPGEKLEVDPRKFELGALLIAPRVKLSFKRRKL